MNALTPASLAIDALPGDARHSFNIAAENLYRGIAFATSHAELNPDALGETGRRHLKVMLAGKNLGIEAIRAAVPLGGLANAATIDRSIENARKAMLLARQLGATTVSLNIGRIPQSSAAADAAPAQPNAVNESTLIAALRELAQQADAAGVTLAIGAESGGGELAKIMKAVDFQRARINFDTARAIASGQDPVQTAEDLGEWIGAITLADAVRSGRTARGEILGNGQLPLKDLVHLLKAHGLWDNRTATIVDLRDLADAPRAAQHAAELLRRL